MAISDHINLLGVNPLTGPNDEAIGPRFLEPARRLRPGAARASCRPPRPRSTSTLAEGVYLATAGPTFETPAEIRAFRTLGADAVGMSTVPEVILARHAGLRVAAVSAITNLAEGMGGEELSHEQTLRNAEVAARDLVRLVSSSRRISELLAPEVIRKKRDGGTLTEQEIAFLVGGITDGGLSDAQVGALAMAFFLRGLEPEERLRSRRAMRDSGSVLEWDLDQPVRGQALHGRRRRQGVPDARPDPRGVRRGRADDLRPRARPHRRDAGQAGLDPRLHVRPRDRGDQARRARGRAARSSARRAISRPPTGACTPFATPRARSSRSR